MFWSDFNDFGGDWFRMRRAPLMFTRSAPQFRWQPEARESYSREEVAFPAVNVWSNEEEVLVQAEIPGVNANTFDISVVGKALTIKGERPHGELREGERFLRQERGNGAFSRTVELPFAVDAHKVDAQYKLGVLKIVLPRAEQDKPKKITIR